MSVVGGYAPQACTNYHHQMAPMPSDIYYPPNTYPDQQDYNSIYNSWIPQSQCQQQQQQQQQQPIDYGYGQLEPFFNVPSPSQTNDFSVSCQEAGLPTDGSIVYQYDPVTGMRLPRKRNTANKKERRRTHSINSAFAQLRGCIPNVPSDTKLSKIKTLKLATSYIAYLMDILNKDDPKMADGFKAEVMKKAKSDSTRRRDEMISMVSSSLILTNPTLYHYNIIII